MTVLQKARTLKTDMEIKVFVEKIYNTGKDLLDIEILLVHVGLDRLRVLDLIEEWQVAGIAYQD